jgi:hypothetical protein
MKKHSTYLISLAMVFFFAGMTILSCKKTGPTIAIISVVDTIGRAVSGAKVTLWQDTAISPQTGQTAYIRVTKTSDAAGRAQFEFQLDCYLNIDAIKNGDTAKSFVKLIEHETSEKTVRF